MIVHDAPPRCQSTALTSTALTSTALIASPSNNGVELQGAVSGSPFCGGSEGVEGVGQRRVQGVAEAQALGSSATPAAGAGPALSAAGASSAFGGEIAASGSLAHNAGAIMAYHNHPSSVAEPSASDVSLTSRVKDLFEEVDVRLLDHIGVSRTETVSMAARGLI